MKFFFVANWYRLLIGCSVFMLSVSLLFFVLTNTTAYAGGGSGKQQQNVYIVTSGKNFYEVTPNTAEINRYKITYIGTVR